MTAKPEFKYWLLTTEYPPFYGGGISTYCYHTAHMLTRAGISVTVFVQDDSVNDHTISGNHEEVRIIRFNPNRSKTAAYLGYNARLSYEFEQIVKVITEREGKPDAIEAQDYLGIAYYLSQSKHIGYKYLQNVPIVITLHSPAFIYLEYNRVATSRFPDFWTCEMEKQAIKAVDLLISPTHYLPELIQRYMDISDKKIMVIPNPYETNEQVSTSFSRNKIVFFGKLSPQKGSFELLEHFKELWDNGFPHPLHIIGGTDIVYHPEMKTMGQIIEKKYGAYIRTGLLKIHGKIRPKQIKEYLDDAHVIIFPSLVDNLPYAVMDAMSIGKIILASIQGGQKEMIEDESTGFLFDHNDPSSFKSQLYKILSLSDQEIYETGRKARLFIKNNYSYQQIITSKRTALKGITTEISYDNMFPFLYQESFTSHIEEKEDELLSIVIPYYNMGKYLDDCIRSILDSSYKKIEILIINDGSTDPFSLSKLNEIEHNPLIKVINNSNKGLAISRNEGAKLATGRFLAFIDADDRVNAEYYSKAINCLQRNKNVFFAGSWVQYFENSKDIWPTFTPQPPYILTHNSVNSSGLVYKRNAFLSGGENDKNTDYGLEDYESVINMMSNGYNGVIIPEVLFYYRVRSGSMFRNITSEKLIYSNKYIAKKHAGYYTKFAFEIINLLNANGPGYLFDNPTFSVNVKTTPGKENILMRKLKSVVKRNEQLKRLILAIKKMKP